MIVTDGTVAIEEDEIEAAEALNGKSTATNDSIDSIIDIANRIWYDATSQKAVDVAIKGARRGLEIRPITNRNDKGPALGYKLYPYMKKAPTGDREYEDEVRILEEATNMAVTLRGKAVSRGIASGFETTHKTFIKTEEHWRTRMMIMTLGGEFTCKWIMNVLEVLKSNEMFITDMCGFRLEKDRKVSPGKFKVIIGMSNRTPSSMELERVSEQVSRISSDDITIKKVVYEND